MKSNETKLSIAILLIGIFLVGPTQIQATSGACSSHGGVNCDAGRQPDGTVYCNDNWTDSMVQYDYMVMCKLLNPECARKLTYYIRGRDENLNEIEKSINSYLEDVKSMSMSNPSTRSDVNAHLNYLYSLRDSAIKRYNDMISKSCAGATTKTPFYGSGYDTTGYQCKYAASTENFTNARNFAYSNIEAKISSLESSGGWENNKNALNVLYTQSGIMSSRYIEYIEDCAYIDALIKQYESASGKCSVGFVSAGNWGGCVAEPKQTNDQICKNDYGNNSVWSGDLSDKGTPLCNCATEHVWNTAKTACVYVPPKTNYQICQDAFGSNSNWSGDLSDKGTPLCNCATGYIWNTAKTACVHVPPKTNDQKCQDSYGLNSGWDGTKTDDGRLGCDCQAGYALNTTRTTCILNQPKNIVTPPAKNIVTPPVTPDKNNEPTENAPHQKKFFPRAWSWFKGLFGF